MYRPKFFETREFVPEKVYKVRGDKSIQLMDDRILITSDQLRAQFGRAVINTWFFWHKDSPAWIGDSSRNWSGLRVKGSPYGGAFSQHRFGRAVDMLFRDVTPEEARKFILAHPDLFPYVNSLELGVSWLHVDCRNCDRIMTYSP
jgi:hypothetical protein